jgi:hypothetical protein
MVDEEKNQHRLTQLTVDSLWLNFSQLTRFLIGVSF